MKTILKAQGNDSVISIDLESVTVEETLVAWFMSDLEDIYWDIEFQEGGTIDIDHQEKVVTFSGDNGIYVLEPIEITEL